MRIYLIRHGETESNARRIVQRPDDPLSEKGLLQAARLAERIAGYGIKRLVSSDLPRAAMTAQHIADATGVAAEFTEILHERNFGDLRGTPYEELTTDPFAGDYRPPGGESWDQFHSRVAIAWYDIEKVALQDEPIAVVTHGLVLRSILARHIAVDLNDREAAATAQMIPNTSVTTVEKGPSGWRVSTLACTEHLKGLTDAGAAV